MPKDRITELRRVKASELAQHPLNWRVHGDAQKAALADMLDKVGWADALIAREDDDGNLHLIDGHLRADLAEDDEVPVLIVDLSEAEGDAVLATLDPIAALAGTDEAALSELLTELEFGPDVSEMLSQLADVPTNGDEVQHWQQRDVDFNSQEVDDGIEAVPRRLTFEFNEQERGWLLEAAALLQVRWELPTPEAAILRAVTEAV